MKLIIAGHKHHGKDTVSNIFQSLGFTVGISSWMACRIFIYQTLKEKYGYATQSDCYDDRINHRAEWYELIRAYNTPDKARLGKELFAERDIYNGIRDLEELQALRREGQFDFLIWVDASARKEPEGLDSMNVTREHADYVINNNGPIEALAAEVHKCRVWMNQELFNRRIDYQKKENYLGYLSKLSTHQELLLQKNKIAFTDICEGLNIPKEVYESAAAQAIGESFNKLNEINAKQFAPNPITPVKELTDREVFHQSSIEDKFLTLFDRVTELEKNQ